jgi:thymidine phosphorylase
LILDVKFGSAAFMQTKTDARKLARAMVKLGNQCGVNTRAILNDMNTPLGRAAGNWLEVKESVECLDGKGPDDLRRLVVDCAAQLLMQTRRSRSLSAARQRVEVCLDSGEPKAKWDEMLAAQGADMGAFHGKLTKDHTSKIVMDVRARSSGFISKCDAKIIGEVIRDLGGGRTTKDSVVNFDVGVDRVAKLGEFIESDAVLCRIHAASKSDALSAQGRLRTAFEITTKRPKLKNASSEMIL